VTEAATGVHIFVAVALHAAIHRRDLGHLGHDVHLRYLPVTSVALDPGFQMGSMVPEDKGRDGVDASPRDWIVGLGEFGQLLDGRFVFGDRDVTGHAAGGGG